MEDPLQFQWLALFHFSQSIRLYIDGLWNFLGLYAFSEEMRFLNMEGFCWCFSLIKEINALLFTSKIFLDDVL